MNKTISDNSSKPDDDASADSTLVCISCSSELVTRSVRPEQRVRCAQCSTVQDSTTAPVRRGYRGWNRLFQGDYRSAWWSLLLGVSSVFLMFLTGLPAIYCGIRSLLRMRYIKPTTGERWAAISGTILGTLFGVFMGGCFLAAGGLALTTYLTFERADSVAEAQAMFDKRFTIDVPDEIVPHSGFRVLNSQTHINFSDNANRNKRTARIRIIHLVQSLEFNHPQIESQLRGVKLRSGLETKRLLKDKFQWEICGETVTVNYEQVEVVDTEEIVPDDEAQDETNTAPVTEQDAEATAKAGDILHRYHTVFAYPNGTIGIRLVFKSPPYDLTHDEVQQIFESLKPVD